MIITIPFENSIHTVVNQHNYVCSYFIYIRGFCLAETLLRATVKDEMLCQLIMEHSKLIDDLIQIFNNTPINKLVRYFNMGNEESLSSHQIQGTTAEDFFDHLIEQNLFKYYAPDFLLNFVAASHHKEAFKKVTDYINNSHHTLLKDFNLICESERVTRENIQSSDNEKRLHIKSEAKPLSSEKESFIRDALCKYLKLPPHSVSFLGPKPGCVTLVYKHKMTDSIKQLVLQDESLVEELVPLADLNVIWLRIDNEMELKIPSVKEFMEVKKYINL